MRVVKKLRKPRALEGEAQSPESNPAWSIPHPIVRGRTIYLSHDSETGDEQSSREATNQRSGRPKTARQMTFEQREQEMQVERSSSYSLMTAIPRATAVPGRRLEATKKTGSSSRSGKRRDYSCSDPNQLPRPKRTRSRITQKVVIACGARRSNECIVVERKSDRSSEGDNTPHTEGQDCGRMLSKAQAS